MGRVPLPIIEVGVTSVLQHIDCYPETIIFKYLFCQAVFYIDDIWTGKVGTSLLAFTTISVSLQTISVIVFYYYHFLRCYLWSTSNNITIKLQHIENQQTNICISV